MQRRIFSSGLLASAIASPMILTGNESLANPEQRGERDHLEQLSRVILILGAQQVLITYLIIMGSPNLHGLNLKVPVPQFNENRASTGKLPLLGGLFRKTIPDRFSDTALVGFIYLLSNILFIVPRRGPISNVSRVVIAHRKLSWEPMQKPQKMRMSNLPLIGALKNTGKLLGTAHQSDRELLVIVKPSIVSLDE